MSAAQPAPTPAAAAFSARVGELLAMFDRTGAVTAEQVEPLPDGRVGYALRHVSEVPPTPGAPVPPIGASVQLAAQITELVVQAQGAGLVLREVVGGSAPAAQVRTEVALVGSLLQTLLPTDAGVVPPVLSTIIRRAVDPEVPNPYASVRELQGDLARLLRTIPAPISGATIALSRVGQSLGTLEIPGLVTVNRVFTLPDGRTGYGLRLLLDGSGSGSSLVQGSDDLLALMVRLSSGVVQGRDAGLVLREVTSRGVTLPLTGAEPRPELTALGTILRDAVAVTQTTLAAPLAAMLERTIDPEAKERYEDVAELQGDLAAQQQLARLIPQPMNTRADPVVTSTISRVYWFVIVTGMVVVAVLVLTRR